MGFLIVPRFETDQILIGTAALLVVVGSLMLARHARSGALALIVVPALTTLAPKPALPAGITILDRAQSLYGLVEVIDDVNRDVRLLRADHSIIGAQFRHDRSPAFAFIHLLEAARFLRPNMKDMLEVGLGVGSLPSALARDGIRSDVVEIDPAVVLFAERYFGFATQGEIHVEDARTYLARTERRYDLVVHDTFTGGTTPEHLLSLEVLQRIHALLRPNGVLVLNFAGYADGPYSDVSRMVARTVHAQFPNVRVFRDSPADAEQGQPGNLVFFASDGPLDFTIPATARFENEGCERIQRSFERWEVFQNVGSGSVITDGHNSLGRLQLPVAEAHFEAMNQLLPIAVWLN
jgi:SAM-dependent methyltransferase